MGWNDVVGLDGTSSADGSTLLDSKVECIGGALENFVTFLTWLLSLETLSPPIEEVILGAKSGMETPARSYFALNVVPSGCA